MLRKLRSAALRLSLLLFVMVLHLARIASIDANAHEIVSLRMLHGNIPVASVSVNGRAPVAFVIDTGTNTTLVDPALALYLDLKPVGTKRLTSLSGFTIAARYVLDTISVGTASRSRLEALAQPMIQLQRLDPDIQGIVGLDFLAAFSFRIDYTRSRFALYTFADQPAITGGICVPLRFADDRFLVPVQSANATQGTWHLALDSGISQLLIFEDRFVGPESRGLPRRNCLQAASNALAPSDATQVATNLSSTPAKAVTLDNVTIGAARLARVPAIILPSPPAPLAASEDGLLPASLFRSVFVDRTNALVIFDPD